MRDGERETERQKQKERKGERKGEREYKINLKEKIQSEMEEIENGKKELKIYKKMDNGNACIHLIVY